MDAKKLMEQSRKVFQKAVEPLGHKDSSDELEKAASKKVTIYALSTCPWCKKARKFFTEKGATVEYIEYDKADEETRKYIQEDCKSYMDDLGFPVVKIDGEAVVGYNTKKYASLLYR